MDNFHETLVAKRPTGSDRAKRAVIIIAAIILALLVMLIFMVLFPINIVISGLLMYGAYYLVTGLETEYEYTVTNGEIDFDKISGKRKRKRLITADIRKFERYGRLSDAPEPEAGTTTVQVSDNTGENEYFADFRHDSLGSIRVVFSPDEEMLKVIEPYLPGPVRSELKRTNFLKK